jgi:hypothetical protein
MIIPYTPGKPLPDLSSLTPDDRAYIEWYAKHFHMSPVSRIDFIVGGNDVLKEFHWAPEDKHEGLRKYWERWRERILMENAMLGIDSTHYAVVIQPSHAELYPNWLAADRECMELHEKGKDACVVRLIPSILKEYTGIMMC